MALQPPPDFDPQAPSPENLLWAYRHGVFPMSNPLSGELEWFAPNPRAVIPLDSFHVPRNLLREVRKGRFAIRSDSRFEEVMRRCAQPRSPRNLPWINEALVRAYVGLHCLGHAHSIEAWLEGRLVGGLYGVHLGAAFFGESMFSDPASGGSNSSKVCLVHLVSWLRGRGFLLLDTQFHNEHLRQFGCVEIPRARFMRLLNQAVPQDVSWGQFAPLPG